MADRRRLGPVASSMYVGNAMLLLLNLPPVGLWVQMLRVPYGILALRITGEESGLEA